MEKTNYNYYEPFETIVNVPYDCFIDTTKRNIHLFIRVSIFLESVQNSIIKEDEPILNIKVFYESLSENELMTINWANFCLLINKLGLEHFKTVLYGTESV